MGEPTFHGDEIYSVECAGDACCGDHVAFERAVFVGSYPNSRFAGFVLMRGEIISESYGAAKQQHTFTLRLVNGATTRIKGRNLYANGLWRMPWADETKRRDVLAEKHARGNSARAAQNERRGEFYV